MSLRGFHLLFICTAIILSFLFAGWCFATPDAMASRELFGTASVAVGGGLMAYGSWVYRKFLLMDGAAR